jgi:hypothetical protein
MRSRRFVVTVLHGDDVVTGIANSRRREDVDDERR